MNKSALKTFATSARRELLKKVEAKAMKIGITEDNIKKADIESSDAIFIDGRQLSKEEKIQRNKLIDRINQIGFRQVMEEVAYTWFNRFTALRFMEVNDYLPTKIRVLSSTNAASTEPDMMKEALSLDLDLDKEYVYELKMNNNSEELFKYLIIKHCNDLNRYMPFMFEKIDDYTEILFPEGLLATDSFVRHMTNTEIVPDDNWKEIEVIGWLYQYYIAEEKDQVFANLKKNIKITKDTLPAATQLFTPNWIVRYMVENSLGRIWLESNPKSNLRSGWKYYLDDAEQEDSVLNQLEEIRYQSANPEEIKFLDPCCGSGHILVYAFDIFYEMYLEKGYMESEIPKLILENNLYGLDVDDRAAQLASFAIFMKAREKSRRVFKQNIKLNIHAIQESNWISDEVIDYLINGTEDNNIRLSLKNTLNYLRDTFWDAKEYGSILNVEPLDLTTIEKRLFELVDEHSDLFGILVKDNILDKFPGILLQAKLMSTKYDVVCTNPPYMGSNGMGEKLSRYLKSNFPNVKSDMSTVFMEKAQSFCKSQGLISMINIPVWMFLASYKKLREHIISHNTIVNMLHFGRGVFGSDFGTTAFVILNSNVQNYSAVYRRLFSDRGAVESLEKKEQWFFSGVGKYYAKKEDFIRIPSIPIAYWASENMLKTFKYTTVGSILTTREGMATADNDRFLKLWHEVNFPEITFNTTSTEEALQSKGKWFPYNKGGSYRKWYGNNEYIVNWEDDGNEIKNNIDKRTGRIRSHNYNGDFAFKKGITWSALSMGNISVRYCEEGFLFDSKGAKGFSEDYESSLYVLALINSIVGKTFLEIISPTIDFKVGDVIQIPLIIKEKGKILEKVQENILLSKGDWDSFETSWGFRKHPLIESPTLNIKSAFEQWVQNTESQFNQQKANEEGLNRIFINNYDLRDELIPEVNDKDIAIRKSDLERDIKSFISYGIGCSFGRYSLDEEGLIYAGGKFNPTRYKTFPVDQDNILPILPGSYFEDDIVTRFVDFVKTTFGEGTLSENLDFVADALGRRNDETAKETLRRYFLNNFYKDHVKTYSKRPIYWLFTSGKEKAFNCLIYMHRYDKTTLSRIRTDYLHDYQIRLDAEKKDLLNIIEGDSTAKEISNAKKELKSLEKKIDELKAYDELLHHMADMQIEIDLDDGVKVNYEKFKGLVAKL
ncbi:BREX-1 system adenine-specific DNA-methyltransferase PglX [Oceanobacillus chungangensis]|uniref:site-specific DNA-methyltransferase (adenine-specific) n=1 Tax=Oceanobacillus chungangensis TaxID=1229152 RepID=A0A3D8PRN0_9BACI|nr:BREX-1 system adenine-specific DNA-methyltransferase PglX [Oceanobacillus chungangensis]RDW18790.1 SAM-dependent methyltransferase [Oceanobacillus chungangensis]